MPSSTEINIDLVRRLWNGLLDESNLDLYDEYFSSDLCVHGPATGQTEFGIAYAKAGDQALTRAFKRLDMKLHDLFASEDRVVIFWTVSATHKSEYQGIPAQEDTVTSSGMTMYRIANGKICEVWISWDRLGMLEQIADVQITPKSNAPESNQELIITLGMEKYLEQASLLSNRERQCLKYLLEGKTAKETADSLSLSPRTVEFYFENIKRKLNCWSKRELFTTAQIMEKLELL